MTAEMPVKTFEALIEAREHDPFRLLGLHADGRGWRLTVFRPRAASVAVAWRRRDLVLSGRVQF